MTEPDVVVDESVVEEPVPIEEAPADESEPVSEPAATKNISGMDSETEVIEF